MFCGTFLLKGVNYPVFRVGLLRLKVKVQMSDILEKNHGILCQCPPFLVVFDDFSAPFDEKTAISLSIIESRLAGYGDHCQGEFAGTRKSKAHGLHAPHFLSVV